MSVTQDLVDALKTAMKARDQIALDAIRSVQSPMKLAEKEKGEAMEDSAVHALLQKAIKQRKDSIEVFKKGKRDDLADKEQAQMMVLQKFLPEQLDEAALSKLVEEAVAETGAETMKEMGKVMAWLMPKIKGKADGGMVNRLVKAKLGA